MCYPKYVEKRNEEVKEGRTIYAQNKAEMFRHIVEQEKEIKELKNTIKKLIKRYKEDVLSTL